MHTQFAIKRKDMHQFIELEDTSNFFKIWLKLAKVPYTSAT